MDGRIKKLTAFLSNPKVTVVRGATHQGSGLSKQRCAAHSCELALKHVEDLVDPSSLAMLGSTEGKVYTVRYEAVNAKEHKTVHEQGATIAQLEKKVEALSAGLQKVSAEIEANKAAPQTAMNNR